MYFQVFLYFRNHLDARNDMVDPKRPELWKGEQRGTPNTFSIFRVSINCKMSCCIEIFTCFHSDYPWISKSNTSSLNLTKKLNSHPYLSILLATRKSVVRGIQRFALRHIYLGNYCQNKYKMEPVSLRYQKGIFSFVFLPHSCSRFHFSYWRENDYEIITRPDVMKWYHFFLLWLLRC